MARLTLAATALLCLASFATASTGSRTQAAPSQTPSTIPIENQLTSHGCYSALPETAQLQKEVRFVSSGSCFERCQGKDKTVMILFTTKCYCADTYPPRDSMVEDSKCNYSCPGYNKEACGGIDDGSAYSVFNTGVEVDVEYDDSSSSKAPKTTVATHTSSLSKPSASDSSSNAYSSYATPSGSATSDSYPASNTTSTATQASSTPSESTVGESGGATYRSQLMGISAWLFLILAL